jgi:hypothetical protein
VYQLTEEGEWEMFGRCLTCTYVHISNVVEATPKNKKPKEDLSYSRRRKRIIEDAKMSPFKKIGL